MMFVLWMGTANCLQNTGASAAVGLHRYRSDDVTDLSRGSVPASAPSGALEVTEQLNGWKAVCRHAGIAASPAAEAHKDILRMLPFYYSL